MSKKPILVYGRTTAKDRGVIVNHETSWEGIVDLFREPTRRKNVTLEQYLRMTPKERAKSKNTGLFFGGKCDNGHRHGDSLVSRSIVNLDLDDNVQAVWEDFRSTGAISAFEGLAYLVHTTRSHTDETPKLRILVPLAREVEPEEYEPVARALAQKIDGTMRAVARESYTPAQGMYFPSVSSDQEYHFRSYDGDFFDPAEALAKYPADDASTWPKKLDEKVTIYVPGRKMTHPEDKKAQAPIIAAVHRAFDPWEFIEEFLDDIYIPDGDRYYPVGASGAPSVRIYDDAFVHSDHGTDPAVGQHNTFDLGRIHLFRHLDAEYDTDSMSPVDWPSFQAMSDFMLQRPEVREALAAVEAELAEQKNRHMLDLLDALGDEPEDEEEDLVGDVDDIDDLIGGPEPAKKGASIEDVLLRVRKSINNAKSLDDLERRLEIIRGFPTSDFRDLHRDLVAADVQRVFEALSGGEKITKATARKMLAPTIENLREQAKDEPLPAWIKHWVFVTSENKFLHLESKQMLSRDGFNGLLAVEAGERFGVNNNGMSIISAADAALSVFDVAKPYKTTYRPGEKVLFEEDGMLLVNTFRRAEVPAGGYKGKEGVKLLKRLLTDLFPEKAHRAMIMDFLVHKVRYPEKKLKYALLIKGAENEGKSLLADLLTKLLGQHNCAVIGNDQLKEKFNGWGHERLFCVVEEICIPGKEAHEVLNKLKPVVTNRTFAVRKMQKDVETVLNFCDLYLTSNYDDCLPLEEDNSRYLVIFTCFRTNQEVKDWHARLLREEGVIYPRQLWEHIQYRPAQFLEAFANYEFSEYYDPDGGRAPDTVFKKIMAEDGKSEERQLLEQMLDSGENPTITKDILLWGSFRAILDRKGMAPALRNRAIGRFLKPFGYVKAKQTSIRVKGEQRCFNVWTQNLELLDKDYNLTQEGRERVVKAAEAADDLDDFDSLADNVIPINRKR